MTIVFNKLPGKVFIRLLHLFLITFITLKLNVY